MKKLLLTALITLSTINVISFDAKTNDVPQLEDGVLSVGTNCQYAPFEYTVTEDDATDSAYPLEGSNGYCDGYDMQWLHLIEEKLDVDVEVTSMDFAGLVPALNSGSVDVVVSAMSPTPERKEELNFTNNYYDNSLVMSIVTTKDGEFADAKDSSDFEGANITYGIGTSHGEILASIDGINSADPLEGADTLIQATLSGSVDGYFTDHEAAVKQAASNDNLVAIDLTDIDIDPAYSGYAMATTKDDDSLVTAINTVIDSVDLDEQAVMMDEASQKQDGTWVEESENDDASQYGEQLADGVFTIGTDCAYAPYAFATTAENASSTAVKVADGNSYCDGYDIMIASKLADYFGVDLEVKVISFDGLTPALNSGQIDGIVAGMSATPDRMSELDFSDNYYDSDLVMSIVMNANGDYADAKDSSDFTGAEISSQLGTFHGDILPQIDGITIVNPMESPDVLMQATAANQIDGYITEHEVAVEQAESSEDLTYTDLDDLEIDAGFSGVAIGIKKGSDTFTNAVNEALATISDKQRSKMMEEATSKNDGTYEEDTNFFVETWNLFTTNKSLYIAGIKTTLVLALAGTLLGTLFGFILVGMRIQTAHYKDKFIVRFTKKALSIIAVCYIDLIRGTPMMVQAMLFFYGIAANIMEPNTAGIIIISFNTAAYVAEILRSGINALDKGQMEAGRSLGLTNTQTFISIIIPQTIKNTLPALANQLILNIKDSSVLSVIAVSELFYATKQAASAGYMYTQAYFISAVVYLALTVILTRLLIFVMKKVLTDTDVEKAMTLE